MDLGKDGVLGTELAGEAEGDYRGFRTVREILQEGGRQMVAGTVGTSRTNLVG